MPMLRRSLFPILAALALLAVLPGPALAKSLDQYRAEGVIAERFDGFVELREQNAPAEAKQIVAQVNAKRQQLYEQRAKEQNVSADAVGKVYAQQIVESAPKGTYFKQPSGAYTRK